MESLIIAVAALLILLPILYFLPIGFTFKGKVVIAAASFLIGIFGLVAASVFELWQTALVLLLVVGGSAYLMNRWGDKWFYLKKEENDSFDLVNEPKSQQGDDNHTYAQPNHSKRTAYPDEDNIEMQNETDNTLLKKLNTPYGQEISLQKKPTDDINKADFEKEQAKPSEEQVEAIESNTVHYDGTKGTDVNDFEIQGKQDFDLEALFEAEESVVEQVGTPVADKKDSDGYLSEIEKIIEEDVDEKPKVEAVKWSEENDYDLEELVFDEDKTKPRDDSPKAKNGKETTGTR